MHASVEHMKAMRILSEEDVSKIAAEHDKDDLLACERDELYSRENATFGESRH
jgi:hypothetical protein